MHDEIVGAQGDGTLQLSAKCCDRLAMELGISARQVDQVVGMDHQWLQVVTLAEAAHLSALRGSQFVGRPLARARRENLERVAAQAISAFGGVFDPSGGRSMNADAAGGQLRRLRRRSDELEDVLLELGTGVRHERDCNWMSGRPSECRC